MKESQYQSLKKICDVFIPSIEKENDQNNFWKRKASDFEVVEKILLLIEKLKVEDQEKLSQAFGLIDSPLLGLTWFGPLKSAKNLSEKQIEEMLKKWSVSPIADIRNLYNTLKKLVAIVYFGASDETGNNPNHASLMYEKALKEKPINQNKLNILQIERKNNLECDVVIVGSGSGGSVVAAQLAQRGQKVIIIEKGQYGQRADFTQEELKMLNNYYESQGLLTSISGSTTIMAGSSVGGGTTINWAGSLRTPDYVLEQWAKDFDNPHFLDTDYKKGFEFIEKRNNVNSDIRHNLQNQLLFETAEKNNMQVGLIPQNVKKPTEISDETFWKAQGFACVGDAYGIKQSASETFLADACAAGAEILPNAFVEKILIKNSEAYGVEVVVNQQKINILAKKVVVSSGAIHTPALLLKSGLRHHEIGKNLFLHPVVPILGRYEQDVFPWNGPMMTTIVKDFAQLDGNYGFRIECPPVHPGLASVILSWESGEIFKQEMLNLKNIGVFFPLVRDKFGGQVKVTKKSKQPEIHYTLSDYDKKHLLQGFEETIKLQIAAGVERISIPHNQQLHFFPKKQSFESMKDAFYRQNWNINYFGLYSAHQMGTCRMGGNNNCPIKPNGETREVKNLFVADTSLFPSASGANPMLSVQALAYYVSLGM